METGLYSNAPTKQRKIWPKEFKAMIFLEKEHVYKLKNCEEKDKLSLS